MTDLLERVVPTPRDLPEREPSWWSRHWQSVTLCAVLSVLCGVATSYNIYGNPVRFKDEGVYLAQAWAIPNLKALAHYTYWYDHPPLGWIQMSVWATLTDGWDRWRENTTMAGREFMVVIRVATCLLLFALARRLGLRRFWATVAVLLFVLSPLAMYYGRLTLLDNVATPWVLASFVLAFSRRRTWGAAVGSALCFAIAITTKETLLLIAPALALALWLNFRTSTNRHYAWVSFGLIFTLSVALYPLYAVIKSELLPGEGHVSLVGAIEWQLSARKGSGSVFDPNSDARALVDSWLALDTWLPACGLLAAVVLILDSRFRPLTLAVAIQVAMLLRQGYLPSMYVVSLLPFFALSIATLCDRCWPSVVQCVGALRGEGSRWRAAVAMTGAVAVAGFWLLAVPRASDGWFNTLKYQWTVDADASQREVVAWLRDNVSHDSVVVAEGEMWLDLHNAGFSGQGNVWVYKVDSDPAVAQQLGTWHSIDYLALSRITLISESKATMPMVFEAVENSDQVAQFGTDNNEVVILKVRR